MEVSNDPARKAVETKTGLKLWGYKSKRELANENIIDGLTGLLNRKGWDQKVMEYQKLARRMKQEILFFAIDMDDFKKINDSQGHETGDKLLKEFADVLRKSLTRSTDILARYGGDEFAVCMLGTTLDQAKVSRQKLLDQLGEIKVSIGVGSDFGSADEDMYRVKNSKGKEYV